MDLIPTLPAAPTTAFRATSATSDEMLVESWIAGMTSKHTKRNNGRTAERFIAALAPLSLRDATVEDIRAALDTITAGMAPSSRATTVGHVKSLLSYGTRLGYLPFNAGTTIKNKGDHRNLAKRIVSEVDVALLIRHADNSKQARKGGQGHRNRVLLLTTYAAALRISEVLALAWVDVIAREDGKVQLTILGKGEKRREVLLPSAVGKELLALRGNAGDDEPVFQSRQTVRRKDPTRHPRSMSITSVTSVVKRAAKRAGINPKLSMHWLRHAHASHAIDRGAVLSTVQATLGHSSIAVTSVYLHARPGSSSAFDLDEGIFA
jgi:integrase/recombinase XerD